MKTFKTLNILDEIYLVNAKTLKIKAVKISSIQVDEISIASGYYNKISAVDENNTKMTYRNDSNDRGFVLHAFVDFDDCVKFVKSKCLNVIESMRDSVYLKLEEIKEFRKTHYDVLNNFDIEQIHQKIKECV